MYWTTQQMDEKETDEEDEMLWTIFFHPFHLLFDPSAIPRPAQGRKQLKIVWQTLGRHVKALWSSRAFLYGYLWDQGKLFCPHLIEAFSSDSIACTDVPGLVHQPLQAEGLRHFHAGHCIPAHQSISIQSSFHNPPAVHLVGKEKDREPPCLDVWVLQIVAKSFGAFPATSDT